MDFKIDVAELQKCIASLYTYSTDVETNIGQIYQGVDAMEEGWQGQSYNDFQEKSYSYKVYLDSMVDTYRTYWDLLGMQVIVEHFVALRDGLQEAYDYLGGDE